MIGRTISHYIIEGRLGAGGMGEVYLARDATLGRAVAIKVLRVGGADDPELAERLLREARAASQLNHPNIITIHEVGQEGGLDFIVMERVEGRALSELITVGGLPIPQALEISRQIVAAVAAAHRAGIVHRDLKPANVIVAPGGRVKVLDFGLARVSEPAGGASTQTPTALATRAGTMMGTIGYMSPEQIQGATADARSDVFSLGVLMFEMLAGRRPFTGDSDWAVLSATMSGSAPSLRSLRPEIPEPVARVVERAMSNRIEARPASAIELEQELDRLAAIAVPASTQPRSRALTLGIVLGIVTIAAIAWFMLRESRRRWAIETAPTEAAARTAQGDVVGGWQTARRALEIAPHEGRVRQLWGSMAQTVNLTSDPPGATAEIRNYVGPEGPWVRLGVTPMHDVGIPVAMLQWRFTRPGSDTLHVGQGLDQLEFHLAPAGSVPPGMVPIPAGSFQLESTNEEMALPAFWLDRCEVTNREFKAFLDSGGYTRPELWTEPFVLEGRTITWLEAMSRFRDITGRPGPSTWELGSYPEGQADFPVSGVSWYEAAAYAKFAGKRLPTAYHWYRASGAFGVFSEIVSTSNFSGKAPVAVQRSGGLGPFGTLGMAGNVKEWCWNEANGGRRYILGGSWSDLPYQFQDEDAQAPFERNPGFGFRCMRQTAAMNARLIAPIISFRRDLAAMKPVGDAVFRAYAGLYAYDPTSLDAKLESIDDANPAWRIERLSVRAAYGNERLPLVVFVPRNARPPYQAIVFFPGSNAVTTHSSRDLMLRQDYLIRSGRMLVYPIYAGTYERRTLQHVGMNELRDISIQRGKDVRRAVDYLQSRRDVDSTRIAFFGVSLGAQLAPVYLAIEPRFRTGVLFSGGFESWDIPPETNPINFAPRVRTPVLMVNGREDFDLPYATAQLPLFRALGCAPSDKRHVVLEGGHIPLHPEQAIRAVLDWLDERLGPVR